MFTYDTLAMFFTASVLLALAPGPDNIFVLTQSMIGGPKAGLSVTAGLCTGLLVHTTAVVLGVAAMVQTSATAFSLVKYAGAAYLLFLAWQAFRSGKKSLDDGGAPAMTSWQFYRRGIIMNVTNPKVSIFFLAFLPQFAAPEKGRLWLQLIGLGGLFIAATLLIFGTISLLAGRLGTWFTRSERGQKILNYCAGSVFLTLAVKLAMAGR